MAFRDNITCFPFMQHIPIQKSARSVKHNDAEWHQTKTGLQMFFLNEVLRFIFIVVLHELI